MVMKIVTPTRAKNTNQSDIQKRAMWRMQAITAPICTLSALYNPFATLLYTRLYPRLDTYQQLDQGVEQRCQE